MSSYRVLGCALALCLGCLAKAAPQFVLLVSPVFQGQQATSGMTPIKVSISNVGPDAVGVVRVGAGDYQMDYPVELPEGSSKDLVVYCHTGQDVYERQIELRTNRGTSTKEVDPAGMSPSPGDYFLEIGGNPGDLGFLSGADAGVAQVKPENAPDRVSAYWGCAMVILADGSERLDDGAVKALKQYMLHGGLMVFPSGTATPLLSDGRWADVLPVRPLQPRIERGDSQLRNMATSEKGDKTILPAPVKGTYSVVDFTPVKGAMTAQQQGRNFIAAKNYGLGKMLFWSFDPLHGSLRDWNGLAQFFKHSAHFALPEKEAVLHVSQADFANSGGIMNNMVSGMSGPRGFTPLQENDAFQVSLPSAGKIGSILGFYFLFVIPINFFILRKIGKRQWGWTTSSVISLIFAGIMLAQARQLYGLTTSHSDRVIVVAQQGVDFAVADGTSQMFASSGGTYDLGMQGVDSIAPAQSQFFGSYDPGHQQSIEMFAPVDMGSVQLKEARFNNLGFGEINFRQVIEVRDLVTIRKSQGHYSVSTKTKLADARLMTPAGQEFIGNLAAGRTATIDGLNGSEVSPSAPLRNFLDVVRPWVDQNECVLVASAPDLPVGPNFGKKIHPDPVLLFFAEADK